MSKVVTYVLALFVIAAGAYFLLSYNDAPESPSVRTFESEQYGFSLEYPEGWQWSSSNDFQVAFNAFIPPPEGTKPPFIHHHNVTNVSIFPDGVPTEGLIGEMRPVAFDVPFEIEERSLMFVLEDGTPFAAYIRPANPPDSWGESGFIWVRAHLDEISTRCFDPDGNEVSEATCDPLGGNVTVRWSGRLEPKEWNEVMQVLGSLVLE